MPSLHDGWKVTHSLLLRINLDGKALLKINIILHLPGGLSRYHRQPEDIAASTRPNISLGVVSSPGALR